MLSTKIDTSSTFFVCLTSDKRWSKWNFYLKKKNDSSRFSNAYKHNYNLPLSNPEFHFYVREVEAKKGNKDMT